MNVWLEKAKVNPIVVFDKLAPIYELERKPLKMDRVGLRRMLFVVEKKVRQAIKAAKERGESEFYFGLLAARDIVDENIRLEGPIVAWKVNVGLNEFNEILQNSFDLVLQTRNEEWIKIRIRI